MERAWPWGVTVWALACDSIGGEFNSRPFRCQVMTLGKLFTHMRLCHRALYWYQSRGSDVLRLGR